MKHSFFAAFILMLLTSCSALPSQARNSLPDQELQETLNAYREAGGMIGVSAALGEKQG